jgi:hypothetical protein
MGSAPGGDYNHDAEHAERLPHATIVGMIGGLFQTVIRSMPMIDLVRSSVASQYGAALAMLRGCVDRADGAAWVAPVGRRPLWHVAYHTLFITDLYLSTNEKAFRPRPFHRENYELLSVPVWAPERKVTAEEPYEPAVLAGYVDKLLAKMRAAVGAETEATLAGPSGFDWLPFTRLELHLYSTRHVQHHAGQLASALRRHSDIGVPWVGFQKA